MTNELAYDLAVAKSPFSPLIRFGVVASAALKQWLGDKPSNTTGDISSMSLGGHAA